MRATLRAKQRTISLVPCPQIDHNKIGWTVRQHSSASVARMERSEIRDRAILARQSPGLRFAPSGLRAGEEADRVRRDRSEGDDAGRGHAILAKRDRPLGPR